MSPGDRNRVIETALMEGDEKCSLSLSSLAGICLPNLNKKEESIIKPESLTVRMTQLWILCSALPRSKHAGCAAMVDSAALVNE